MTKWFSIILGILLLGCGFCFGVYYGQETAEPEIIKTLVVKYPDIYWQEAHPEPLTVTEAIEFVRSCRAGHQVLVNWVEDGHPVPAIVDEHGGRTVPVGIGSLRSEKSTIRKYDQLRDLIIRLDALAAFSGEQACRK